MWEDIIERNVSHQVQNLESLEDDIDNFSKKVYKYIKEHKQTEKDSCIIIIKEINEKFQTFSQQFQDDELKTTKLKKLKKQFQQLEEQFSNYKEQQTIKKNTILVDEEEEVMDHQNKKEPEQKDLLEPKKIVLAKYQQATLNVEKEIAKETFHRVIELQHEMIELNECFRDLEELVNQQQEKLDTIEDNITEGVKNQEVAVQNIKIAGDRTIVKSVTNNCLIQ